MVREAKQFFPTELGFVVIDLLKQYFPDIVNVEFTANLEDKLDKVEEGDIFWKEVLRDFYKNFENELRYADEEIGKIEVRDEVSEEKCDKCGRNFVIKFGRFGKFLACPGFPECRNTKPLFEEIGVTCPDCHKGKVVVRRSKKGRTFYGCDRYPDCQFVSWEKPLAEQCPQCGKFLVEKKSREGKRKVCSSSGCHFEEALVDKEES